jgi:type IV pilus assembly protein PilE
MRKLNSGITLMELMVVMVVVGILTAVAVPGYRQYMMRTNRTDAKTALLAMAGALERCYTTVSSYDPDDCPDVDTDVVTEGSGHYQVSATEQTRTTFTLTAVPQNAQADDAACGNFTLDQANTRGISGTADMEDCWGR